MSDAKKPKTEFFPDVAKVEYKPRNNSFDNKEDDSDILCFRHYNAKEIILGKRMKEWLRFSVCFWHTMRGTGSDPFGSPTLERPWEHDTDGASLDPIALAKRRVDVFFELLVKLGVEYYTFHDFDVAPEGNTIEESLQNLTVITDYLLEKQNATGIKLLWATQNLFSHARYMNGAMTNPNVRTYCQAAVQIKVVMDCIAKLNGLNHVFWGGREGYQTLLNTDLKQECDQMAAMLQMAVDYKTKMKYTAQFLLEPKPREPCKHQYDYDAQTTMAFLHQYNLQDHFKLNIEPNHTTLAGHAAEHDVAMASAYNMLGSIDANTGDPLLGWDTDQFPMDLQQTTAIMSYVITNHDGNGLAPGGLNFDAKVRRESVRPIDIVHGHVGAMDCYALGLKKAAALQQKGTLQRLLQERYASWTSTDIGIKISSGTATLEDCVEYAKSNPEPPLVSGQQEMLEIIRNRTLYDE